MKLKAHLNDESNNFIYRLRLESIDFIFFLIHLILFSFFKV